MAGSPISTPLINRRPSKGSGHVIENISFSRDTVHCICGVKTTVDGFVEHRKDVGLSWSKLKNPTYRNG